LRSSCRSRVGYRKPIGISARLFIECPLELHLPLTSARYNSSSSSSPVRAVTARWEPQRGALCAVKFKPSHSHSSPGAFVGVRCGMNGHSQGLNVMGKLVANIIVEALQSAGAECYCGVVGDSLDRTARSLEKSEIGWISMGHEEARAFAHPDRNSDHSPTHGQGFAGATGASASAHAVSSCFSRGRLLSAVVWWDRDPFAHTA
jgi:hypothetical protein